MGSIFSDIPDAMQEPISHAYLRSDLRNMLAAIAVGALSTQPSPEFAAGFEAALLAVAVATGIAPRPQKRGGCIE